MTTLNVTDLNFDTIKGNLKAWMQAQPDFTDYDFEASGLSYLLDVLAYNTHYNAVLANFAANEMFLDTALKRTSVISHAKALGYHPRGRRGARANLTITIDEDNITGVLQSQMLLPRGTKFTTTKNNVTYTFITVADYTAPLNNNQYVFGDVEIVEGDYYSYSYLATGDYTTKYLIPNPNVDISTIVMRVYSSAAELGNPVYYYHSSTLIDVTESDNVYFTQEAEGGKTEFYFGNGSTVGTLPSINQVIQIEYVSTNGSQGNDIRKFYLSGTVETNGMSVSNVSASNIVVVDNGTSAGGVDEESNDEIKYNASKHFTVQNRAVTSFDYKSIISQNFFNIESIKVWGGEENNPPQYNSVYVCIKPALHDYLTENEKTQIKEIVASKSVMNMRVIFIEPEYLNLVITSNVYYSPVALAKNSDLVGSYVRPAILTYSDTQLEAFSSSFKYSKFVAMIDSTNAAISHNNTTVRVYKTIPVEVNRKRLYNINFSNPIAIADKTIISDTFNIPYGIGMKSVLLTNIGDKMLLGYYDKNSNFVSIQDAGTVDYTNGLVSLTPLTVLSYNGDSLKLYMTPQKNDIEANQNNILRILPQDININVFAEV